ncbi:hypothetical protein IAT38_000111 [Cryptococcus sp. DSM 104549]
MRHVYTHLDEFFALSDWGHEIKGSFGLQPPPGDWAAFKSRINELNEQCPKGESVKVIFAARHGQAEHNTLREKHGIYSPIVQVLFPILDPDLTDLGRQQASVLSFALQREAKRGMPLPEKWFVSAMKRAGETCGIEWGWLFGEQTGEQIDKGHGVPAVVVENIREQLHVHQCDRRSPLSELQKTFPSFTYLPGTTEKDDLWQPQSERGRETDEELGVRMGKGVVECLNMSKEQTYISVTAHSVSLEGMYATLGVPARRLEVGEMNILVVRVKEVEDAE